MAELDSKVNYTEITEADQAFAIEIATAAMKLQEKSERPIYHKDIAQTVKEQLDTQKGGTWNVIVGTSFGSFVTHETKTISHFFVGHVAFLVWRHG
jgi:dynein light chain LC8-type